MALNTRWQNLKEGVVGAATVLLAERRRKYNTYTLEIIDIKQRNTGNVWKGDIQENNANETQEMERKRREDNSEWKIIIIVVIYYNY